MKIKIIWILTGILVSALLLVFLFPGKKGGQETITQPVPVPGNEGVEETIVNTNGEGVEDLNVNTGGEGVEEESVEEIVVEGSEYSFSPASISVRAGEKVSLTFKNIGNTSHNFVVDELKISTKVLSAGQSETIEFVAETDGEVTFFCSVGNHRSLGMEGVLEVR